MSDLSDEDAIERFESAWEESEAAIDAFVPEEASDSRLATLLELVIIDLEFRWKRATSPNGTNGEVRPIEHYVQRFPELDVSSVRDKLIEEEFTIRRRYGDEPTCESFIARFPHLADRLGELNVEFPIGSSRRALSNSNTNRVSPTIDRFTLTREIGEGGMGTVYLARQEQPVRRQVAIKVIRSGLDSKEVIARFEAERQALAMMDHPNIARVYEAGTTDQGHPYFAMEYAAGIPLTDYCTQKRLGIPQRLAVFNDVCAAVQHAHQKGILHRDLKPSNVLITEEEGKPVAKVIDFGLAKAVDSTEMLTDKTVYTHAGQVLGTLKYMSPEQASTREKDVDTRADVYALGVMLYELLTGETPLDENAIRGQGVLTVLELIRDHEPPRPSARLTVDEQTSHIISSERGTSTSALRQLLRGDLDWVVMKALEKDRDRRYDSASSLADDVKRFLSDEPVVARPPSASYRLRKFARKNRVIVTSGIVMVLLLIAGISGTSWQAYRAGIAEQDATTQKEFAVAKATEADQQRQKADILRKQEALARMDAEESRDEAIEANERSANVLSVVVGSFDSANPMSGAKKDMLAREVLVHARKQTKRRLKEDPLGRATLYNALSRSFAGLGEYEDAISCARDALKIRTRELGGEHNETVYSMQDLLNALNSNGNFEEAMELAKRVLEIRNATIPNDTSDIAAARNNLAAIQLSLGKYSEAIENLDASLKLLRADANTKPATLISVSSNLAYVQQQHGSPEKALEILEPLLEECQNSLGHEAPITFSVMSHLGLCYASVNRFDDAIRTHQKCFDASVEILGRTHPSTLTSMLNLADAKGKAGHNDEAIELFERHIKLTTSKLGAEHPSVLVAKNNLASIYQDNGQSSKSVQLNEEVLSIRRRVLGENHPRTLGTMNNLAIDYLNLERFKEADILLTEALQRSEKVMGIDDPLTGALLFYLATTCNETDPQRAVSKWELAVKRTLAENNDATQVKSSLASAYQAVGRLNDAIAIYHDAIEKTAPDDRAREILLTKIAGIYINKRMPDTAVVKLEAALTAMEDHDSTSSSTTYQVHRDIIICHLWQKQFVAAESASHQLILWLTKSERTKSAEMAFALTSLASAQAGNGKSSESIETARRAREISEASKFDQWQADIIIAVYSEVTYKDDFQNISADLIKVIIDDDVPHFAVLCQLACERMINLSKRLKIQPTEQNWSNWHKDLKAEWTAVKM